MLMFKSFALRVCEYQGITLCYVTLESPVKKKYDKKWVSNSN